METFHGTPRRPGFRTKLVSGIAMYAITRGVTMEQITAATGLLPADLVDESAWLPERVVPPIWNLLNAACPGEPVALTMALSAPLSVFGPLLHVCRHAENQRAILRAFARYHYTLTDNLSIQVIEDGDEAQLRIHHPLHDAALGSPGEMAVAMGVRLRREMTGLRDGIIRVELRHGPIGSESRYREALAAPVHFHRPHNAVVVQRSSLDLPAAWSNPELFRFISASLEDAHQQLSGGEVNGDADDELARIRTAVADNARRSEYGAEALARQVGMSLRKLQRVSRSHGTTVRALLEEARSANAQRLLGDQRLSIEEVSFLLGYSEDRAFRRAFKRWTGTTPAQFRRQ